MFEHTNKPTRSPWGVVQEAEQIAPGMWHVHTAGHGGVKLSRERNAKVPKYMREAGGWYEEDCDWAIAYVVFKDETDKLQSWQKEGDKTPYQQAKECLKRWHVKEYETFFGEPRNCSCGATYVDEWTAGVHHGAHKCARVITKL